MADKNNNPIRTNSLPLPALFIKSYFSTWALMRIGQIHSMNIMSVLLFLVLFYFFGRNTPSLTPKYKNHQLLTNSFASLLSVLYLAGSYQSIIYYVSNGLFQTILLSATFPGLFFFIKEVLLFLSYLLYTPKDKKEHFLLYGNQEKFSSLLKYLEKNRRKLPAACFFFMYCSPYSLLSLLLSGNYDPGQY